MSLVRAMRATSRRTGSKPLMTTVSGVSSMIRSTPGGLLEGADVAALAADDAALHLVGWAGGTTRHGHLRGVVGHDALDRRHDDVAGLLLGLFAGAPLDGPGERAPRRARPPRGPASIRTALASSADMPLTRSRAATCSWRALASSSRLLLELALPIEQLAVALLEHVGALVQLLVALRGGGARGPTARRAWPAPRRRPRAGGAPARPWPGG